MAKADLHVQHVLTASGTVLALSEDGVTLVHARRDGCAGHSILYLAQRPELPLRGVLTLSDGAFARMVTIHPAEGSGFNLTDLGTGMYYCAIPVGEGGPVEINRTAAGAWERFSGEDVQTVPADVERVADGLLVSGEGLGLAEAFVAALRGRADRVVVDALAAAMSLAQCENVSQRLLSEAGLPDALATAYPEDIWAREAIPTLVAWVANGRRPTRRTRRIGPEVDFVATAGVVDFASAAMKLNALCRGQITPSKGPCVIATARNEGVFVLDWLAHHRAIGFEAFFIYTNDNEDASEQLLVALAAAGEINLTINAVAPNVGPQAKCYADALQFVPEVLDHSWAALIDLDEYIFVDPAQFCDIGEFTAWHGKRDADSVGLNWSINLPNAQRVWRDEPLSERFPHSRADVHLKSVFRPQRFMNSHCHYPYQFTAAPRRYSLADGAEAVPSYPFNEQPGYSGAWVAHFYFKSVEEFLERRTKNRGDQPILREMAEELIPSHLMQSYLAAFDQVESTAPARDCWLPPDAAAEKARLLAIGPVREAALQVTAAFEANMRIMRETISASPRFSQPGAPETRMKELMEGEALVTSSTN